MATFDYIASQLDGKTIRGTVIADNRREVAEKLIAQNLFLMSCKAQELILVEPSAKAQTPMRECIRATSEVQGKIKPKELAVLSRQLAISINAGVSFVTALQRMAGRAKSAYVSSVLRDILDRVLSGSKFSEALAAHPSDFDSLYVGIVSAGEQGGFMPDALNRVADFVEKEIELRAKIKSAMVYPALLSIVATVIVTGMMIFIVPTFVKIFSELNAPLPLPTRWLISISAFLRHGGFLIFPMCAVMFQGGKRLYSQNLNFRAWWDLRIIRAPLFGHLITLQQVTRFMRALSSLVNNGVPALQAIALSRQVVQNLVLGKIVDEVFASVQQGNGISPVLYRTKYFPELVADMVATGESTGTIPEVLNKTADYYDAEVEAAVRDLVTMVEPLLIVIMALVVGFIIAALMLPTIGLSNAV